MELVKLLYNLTESVNLKMVSVKTELPVYRHVDKLQQHTSGLINIVGSNTVIGLLGILFEELRSRKTEVWKS